MNNTVRVLQVLGIMNRGGAENMIMNIYRAIDKTKVQFDFVVHSEEEGAFDKEIVSLGGSIYHCPRFSLSNIFRYSRWWKKFFSSKPGYKIVHSHIRSTASLILKQAKKKGIKTIIHSHSTSNGRGMKSIIKRFLQHNINKYSDAYFSCSYEAGKWLFGDKIVEKDNFYIIKNAINLDNYFIDIKKRISLRKSFSFEDDISVFIHVGRFHESKNHPFLIKLFNEIHKKNDKSRLLLVGEGELKNDIVRLVDELKLNDSVIFTGLRSDVPELLMMADCFLFPSKWEGLPVTVIEAQASGIPCFVSNNVTHDVKITELVHFLPIDTGVSCWVDEIVNNDNSRKDTRLIIKKAGYDVKETALWLQEFYRRF